MKHLRPVAQKCKHLLVLYLLMGWTQAFLQSFGSRWFQQVIDGFADGSLALGSILLYGLTMTALYVVSYLDEYPGRRLEHGIALSLKTLALRKMSVIDYLAYVKLGTGSLIQCIENGASAGGNMLFGFYLKMASELVPAMVFSMVFIYAISPPVMMAIMLGYVLVFIIANRLLKALYKVKSLILLNEEKLNHILVRGFMELVVFRLHRRFGHELRKAESAAGEIVSSKVKMALIHEAFFAIFAVLVGLVKVGIMLYAWQTKALSVGGMVALISLVDNAYVPIAIFNVIFVQYKLDKVAFDKYATFLDAQEDKQLTQGTLVPNLKGDVSFSGVGFAYHQGHQVLRDFHLSIDKGQRVAFVGESGSGKSTVVKLLVGLLHPQQGRIQVGGVDLTRVSWQSYYEHIAYLPQDPPVFDGTLRENLVFDEQVEDAYLMEALHQVGLEGLFETLAQGLDTPLGERGISLSGGQRQQLALARLWFTPAELVILDEATSAIDNLTEEKVMAHVMQRLAGKTVIAVAHRLDSIRLCHEVLVFQGGDIVERGGFEPLLQKQQVFYELYNRLRAET